ncbi:MAG: hypothetical protein IT576_20680 [Verrucomicrobiales bacterium]|nr:hypothetical protein [Verrucomicrobiales bacterium]
MAQTASESELPSLDAESAGGRGHRLLIAAWEQVQIFERLKSRPTGFSDAGVAQIRRWLHDREVSSLPPTFRRRVFERLGMDSEWAAADHSITQRARAWVDHYVAIGSDQTFADLRILLKAPGAKELFPGLEKVVLEKLEMVDLQEKHEEPSKATLVHKAITKTIHEITGITIERPDGVGYFKLPSNEPRETARCALMSLPWENAKLWNGKIHLLAGDLNAAMAAARPMIISKSTVRIEGDLAKPLGEVSSYGSSFKPNDSQPLVILEGGRLRVLQFPGSSNADPLDYVAATDFLATENQVADLIPVEEAPTKWALVAATYGKGNPVVDIDLPLPEGIALGAAIATAFQKLASPASGDEAVIKAPAESFKRWFWDPPLTGKGGLLEGVKGLRKVPHYNDKELLGYSNIPCPLGATPPDSPAGRTKIDSFVIKVRGFPDFIGSPYHSGNTITLTAITAQFLSELSQNLDASSGKLLSWEILKIGPESKFPNQYFPWDRNVILGSMGKRQNLKELVKDFEVIAAGKATGFKPTDYSVTQDPITNLPYSNHQILNRRFRELGKDLPQIAAFLEWADTLFPAGKAPAKERFEKALAEAIGSGEKEQKAKDEKAKKLEAIANGDLTDVKVKLNLPGF